MRCAEIMERHPVCLRPEETARTAARKMRERDLRFVPVCDPAGRVLGTVTDRDLAVRLVAENRPVDTPVAELMTRQVIVCGPQDPVQLARQRMGLHHQAHVLCLDEHGSLIGVVSLSELVDVSDGVQLGRATPASHGDGLRLGG